MEEETWGPRDTAENREEIPEGFKWSRCGKLGDATREEGCRHGAHLLRDAQQEKKTRV